MTETKPSKSLSRRQFLTLVATTTAATALAACEGTPTATPSETTLQKEGTSRETQLSDWDPIIDTFLEQNPSAVAQITRDYNNDRKFFAVSVTHRHGVDGNFKGVMILPISPDLPEPIKGVDQTIFYAIGTRDGRLLPFPENSNINPLANTPSGTIRREVGDELEETLVGKNVTVVRTRVLAPNGQGQMKPTLGTILLDRFPPRRKDAFLQLVREKLLTKKKILEVRKGIPLVLQCFPAKIIKENDKIIYTQADRIA